MNTTAIEDQIKKEEKLQERRFQVQQMYELLQSEKPEPMVWWKIIAVAVFMTAYLMVASFILLYRVIQ